MPDIGKELKIPVDILKEFKGSIRVIEKLKWRGLWPIDVILRKRIEDQIPVLRTHELLAKNFEYALVYKGRNLEADMKELGLKPDSPLIMKKRLIGIPVPWRLLQKMNIDNQKFDIVLAPKY